MRIRAVSYGKSGVKEHAVTALSELAKIKDTLWVDITGATLKELEPLTGVYGFHSLALEDCVRTSKGRRERPKVAEYGSHIFLVSRDIEYDKRITSHQLSIFLGENYLVTIHEKELPSIEKSWKTVLSGNPKILSSGPDFLLYTILDEVTDNYFVILDKIEDKIAVVEDEVVKVPEKTTLKHIFQLKKDLLMFRKPIWPIREVYHLLATGKLPNIKDPTAQYFRDLYDHLIQVMDLTETYRELISGALETYLSSVSNSINEIVKMLTVIASLLFVPTIISGIYGMNFNTKVSPYNMPELNWKYGYPFALSMMALTIIVTLIYFRKKKVI
jgi:magnesium transporter